MCVWVVVRRPCDKNGKSDPFVKLVVHPANLLENNEKDKMSKKLKTTVKCVGAHL